MTSIRATDLLKHEMTSATNIATWTRNIYEWIRNLKALKREKDKKLYTCIHFDWSDRIRRDRQPSPWDRVRSHHQSRSECARGRANSRTNRRTRRAQRGNRWHTWPRRTIIKTLLGYCIDQFLSHMWLTGRKGQSLADKYPDRYLNETVTLRL